MRRHMNSRPKQSPLVTDSRRPSRRGTTSGKPRSLPIAEWAASDRLGWAQACQPAQRLRRGGAASHLAPASRNDIANRYGLYLDFLRRNGRLDPAMGGTALVTLDNVNAFIAELQARVRSVTVWNSVYKLRRAAQLIAPGADFGWLTEIEKDIALVMVPRSKGRPAGSDRASGRSRPHFDPGSGDVRQDGAGARHWDAQRIAYRDPGLTSHSGKELCRPYDRRHLH